MVTIISFVQVVPPVTLDATTAVSLGMVLIVLGATWRISSLLARIEEKLSNALFQLSHLHDTPERMGRMEERMGSAEKSLAALWEINERRSHAP
jgi:hypothetical protein